MTDQNAAIPDANIFREWLVCSRGMNRKSAYDVMSRLRRASSFVSINKSADLNSMLIKIDKHPEFKKIASSTVKIQIKRAVTLFSEFNHY